MPYVELENSKPRNNQEFVARMAVIGDTGDYATDLAGETVVERFGPPRVFRGMLRVEDLNPEYHSSHRTDVGYVIARMGRFRDAPGRFRILPDGKFLDYHGGAGVPSDCVNTWFTEDALRRGIGWTFIQRYYLGSQLLGSFWVSRVFTNEASPFKLRVHKRRA